MKLIKGMYSCQDVPVIIFDHGCSKSCLYCGLSNRVIPEENVLAIGLKDILTKLVNFKGVYLSPTSDCFLPGNANMTHSILENIWSLNDAFVPLVITKQNIPEKSLELFVKNRHRLVLQISVPCIKEGIASVLEPGSVLIPERLKTIKSLTSAGVPVIAVAMPWFDLDDNINDLPVALAKVGILRVIIATGVLSGSQRQKMINSGNERIKYAALKTKLVDGSSKSIYALSPEEKISSLQKITRAFTDVNIKPVICTADNHNLGGSELPLCTKFKHHNF